MNQPIRFKVLSAITALLLCGSAPHAMAQTYNFGQPIAAPDLAHVKKYSRQGVKFDFPGNWQVTSHEMQDKVVLVDVQADKPDISTAALNVQVQVYPAEMISSLKEAADYLIGVHQDGSKNYTKTVYEPYRIGSHEALGAKYENTAFAEGDPLAKLFDIYAMKTCGKGFVCLVHTHTRAVNEKAARVGVAKVLSTLTYSR
ncbi:hypothetical protein OOT46_29675 [Aquabacterium sp. A7-Y]|uniref:hypothetical protein n=1 Tax=Aquabacterium sp. A7-Y TaxID=1349605 RepID=UPI00223DE582|nr:hypothetical protein [Aquabacterium sp. A7-Y]MCW7541972.1 hypothetical protein [Aquabacterium sp. A7-Y]